MKSKIKCGFSCTVLLLCIVTGSLHAHTIFFRNGTIIYGEVKGQDKMAVSVLTGKGLKSFPKREIASIVYQDVKDESTIKRIAKEILLQNRNQQTDYSDLEFLDVNDVLNEARRELEEQEQSALRMNGAWRSVIFPGWGQFYKSQPVRGGFYSSAVVLSLAGALDADQRYRTAKAKAQDPLPYFLSLSTLGPSRALPVNAFLSDLKRKDVNRYGRRSDSALELAGFVWGVSVADAVFTDSESRDLPISMFLSPGRIGVVLSF